MKTALQVRLGAYVHSNIFVLIGCHVFFRSGFLFLELFLVIGLGETFFTDPIEIQ